MPVIERWKQAMCPEHGAKLTMSDQGGWMCMSPRVHIVREPVWIDVIAADDYEGAVEALREYGGCREDCNALSGAPECSCGFEAAMLRALGRAGGQSGEQADRLRAEVERLREVAIGTSSAGGFYCKLCDSPAWSRPEHVIHDADCPMPPPELPPASDENQDGGDR